MRPISPWALLAIVMASASAPAAPADLELLRSAWNAPEVKASGEAERLTVQARGWNPLDKAQVRWQRGYLEDEDRKWSLRLYPKGFGEFRDYRIYETTLQNDSRIASRLALAKALSSRYDLISRLALLKRKQDLSRDLFALVRRTHDVLSYSARKDRNQLRNFLKSKKDLQKIELKATELRTEKTRLDRELKDLNVPASDAFELRDLIAVSDVRERLAEPVKTGDTSLTETQLRGDLDRALASLAYQRSQDRKWIDYLEFSRKEDRKEIVYGFEVGLSLPFLTAPDLAQMDKEARLVRAGGESQEKIAASRRESDRIRDDLNGLLDLHDSLTASKAGMDAGQLKQAVGIVARQDPMLAIELQQGWFDGQEQLADLEFKIRGLYVRYLYESLQLSENPDLDHLSKARQRIR